MKPKATEYGIQILRYLIKGERIDGELAMRYPVGIYPLMQYAYARDCLKWGRVRSFVTTAFFTVKIWLIPKHRKHFRARVLDAVPRIKS